MNSDTTPTAITLTEYKTTRLPADTLTPEAGESLWRRYDANGRQLLVEFPSPKTDHQWQLTPQGWVGHIPVNAQLQLELRPKAPLHNLFRIWSTVYELEPFLPPDRLIHLGSIPEFYDLLADLLARRVLQRARQGLHRRYVRHRQPLPYVRGRIVPPRRQPTGAPQLICHYDQQTADIADNQILAYTLRQIARNGRCAPTIRRAYHALSPTVTPQPFTATDCTNRTYTRLNHDYAPMHALCRFFLDHAGPTLTGGHDPLSPFLVNMARLYERFVAAWLQSHLPPSYRLKAQETIIVGQDNALRFEVDLVLYDENGRSHAVLDTKYKTAAAAGNADVSQVVTYAKAKQCSRAILVYPVPLVRPLDVQIGDVRVETLPFPLDGDLDHAGHTFLHRLNLK